jgi:hypothetical protein
MAATASHIKYRDAEGFEDASLSDAMIRKAGLPRTTPRRRREKMVEILH